MLTITHLEVAMAAIDLNTPFALSFGTLHQIPRVFCLLTGESHEGAFLGIGEASMDFPFSPYDQWDIYDALQKVNVAGIPMTLHDPAELRAAAIRQRMRGGFPSLPPLPLPPQTLERLRQFPAALTALSMACDDLWAQACGVALTDLATGPRCGAPMVSIGFSDEAGLVTALGEILGRGSIPKIKLGKSPEADLATLRAATTCAAVLQQSGPCLSADFNAFYETGEFLTLCTELQRGGIRLDAFISIEQPLLASVDSVDMRRIRNVLDHDFGWAGSLVADESVVTLDDALRCVASGWRLNYKVQKLGGVREAIRIAEATDAEPGTVGGTFPTAIGRAYDLWTASCLPNATLPSDAWQPSTDWFSGERHLIRETFDVDEQSRTWPFSAPGRGPQKYGLGITIDIDKFRTCLLDNPCEEYRAIRDGRSGKRVQIQLRDRASYPETYQQRTGRSPSWNI